MKPAPFDYHCPEELTEAIAILQRYGDEAKILAGGQSLIPLLSLRLSRFNHLVDLRAIEDLRGVTTIDGSIRVGAMTTQANVALPWSGSEVRASGSGIARAAVSMGGSSPATPLTGGAVAAPKAVNQKPAPADPVVPMVAIGVGALLLGGSGGLWLMRRRHPSA